MYKKNDPVTVVGYGPGVVVKDFGHKVRVKVTVDGHTGVPVVPKADVTAVPS